ncbi:MAG: Ig-like domain-containing protein [Spirochaetales bacterium]|nr:Ig-like domain-containing protein [Spirochaetales bacterium]
MKAIRVFRRAAKSIIFPALALCFSGCAALFYVPLEIAAFSPSRAVYSPEERPEVWVEFSAAVDRARAEQAISLSRDGTKLSGRYSWSGDRLSFTSYEAFSTGCRYELRVDTSVEDEYGNSLQRDFVFRFRFGSDTIRPTVLDTHPETEGVDCDPYDHEELGGVLPDDLYHPVTVVFSEPVDRAGFFEAFSLSPAVTGRYEWPTDDTAVFVPAEPYDWQTEYKIKIDTGLKDLEGNTLAEPYTSHFFIGTDRTAPTVLSVESIVPSPARQGDPPEAPLVLAENMIAAGWEADWDIIIAFSEPVTEKSVQTAFSLTPAVDFRTVFDPLSPDRVVLDRAEGSRFRYGETYVLQVKPGIEDRQGNKTANTLFYHFVVNGPYTKPPSIFQIYHLEDIAQNLDPDWNGTWDWMLLHPLDTLAVQPDGEPPLKTSVFDFYFTKAERTTLTAASFAENFRIEYENGCIGVPAYASIRVISPAGAAAASPPLPGGVELAPDQAVVRVCVRLVNTLNGGTLTLRLGREFADQALDNPALHNPLTDDWSLRLRDPD